MRWEGPDLQRVKPIFHQKLGFCWLPNARKQDEINITNAKPNAMLANVTIFHLPHWASHWVQKFALGVQGFPLGPKGFLDPNMLVSAMRIAYNWGCTQRKAQTQSPNGKPQREWVCVLVEYRLYVTQSLLVCLRGFHVLAFHYTQRSPGVDPGGQRKVLGVRNPPPVPFWDTLKLHKEEKTLGKCTQMRGNVPCFSTSVQFSLFSKSWISCCMLPDLRCH